MLYYCCFFIIFKKFLRCIRLKYLIKLNKLSPCCFFFFFFFFNRRIFLFVCALMLGRKIFCLWSKYFQHDQLKLNCSVTKYSPQLACYKPWKLRLKSRHSKSAMPWLKVLNNIWNTNSFLWNRFELAIVFLCFLPLPILMVRKASQ